MACAAGEARAWSMECTAPAGTWAARRASSQAVRGRRRKAGASNWAVLVAVGNALGIVREVVVVREVHEVERAAELLELVIGTHREHEPFAVGAGEHFFAVGRDVRCSVPMAGPLGGPSANCTPG